MIQKKQWMIGILICCVASGSFAATLTVKQDGSGDFQTVQAALDAAESGDTVEVYAGTYNEDIGIGHFNVPSLQKDNITFRAAEGEEVEIIATNTEQRLSGLAAVGYDPGPTDQMGFVINGDNIVIEGIRFVQNSPAPNLLNINVTVTVGGSNIIVRDCEIVGPGAEADGDIVGLVVAAMDVYSLTTDNPHLATNVTVENCYFTGCPYAFANADFLTTGVPPEVTVSNCEFTGNTNAVEIDDGITTVIDCHIHDNLDAGFHLSDDVTTIQNCIIENNGGPAFEIDDQELEDDDAPEHPIVNIENCMSVNNGGNGAPGISVDLGTLTITGTVIAGSVDANLYVNTEQGRETTVTIDHCDLYQSVGGIAVQTTDAPDDIINFTMTNSIVVDFDGIFNNAGVLADFTVEYCDIFTSGTQFEGDFQSTANNLNVDPQYVDPENGDFHLQSGSPVASAGIDGTFMGSKGVATDVHGWMIH